MYLSSSSHLRLTTSGDYELQFDMWDQDEIYAVARYDSFAVTDEADNYRLQVSGYMPPQDSAMDAGDSLSASDGVSFAYKDSSYALHFKWTKFALYNNKLMNIKLLQLQFKKEVQYK